MQSNSGFIAYPGKPSDLASEIKVACKTLESSHGLPNFKTWEENDIAGRFLVDPILENIQKSDILVADITKFNFNVAFEIGYAIGAKKRVVLIKRSDIVGDHDHTLGIFDTLGYIEYSSGVSLAAKIKASLSEPSPLRVQRRHSSGRPRVFLLEPHAKVSYDIALKSALKKSKIGFESYDPVERGRLAAGYAIESVSREDALIARFLPSNRTGSLVHNIRVAFCAGIAHSLGREFLLFQESEDPVPLDYRDLVKWVPDPDEISRKIGDLLLRLFDTIGGQDEQTKPGKESLISKVHFGSSIAENEGRDLDTYYLTTESFMEAERGSVQVVAGRKGAGKTAFFIQLRNSLRRHRQNIVLDLQPTGFQLLKFKERCLSLLSEGSSEHLLAALWEYVILLEVAFRILRDDRTSHVQNHKLNKPYNDLNKFLAEQLSTTNISDEGDFSERLDRVLVHVEQQIGERLGLNSSNSVLSNPVVTEILHSFDLQKLKQILVSYVEFKEGLWILIDNLDKGWPATGVTSDDTRIIRCLQNSLHKIEKTFRKKEVTCRGLVFIRADVYDILMATTPDKGKTHRVSLDLANREILKEIVRLRLGHAIGNEGVEFDEYWPKLFVSHIGATAEATFDFLIDRCLMRPRCLLELIQACRSNAVTLGHDKVTEADLKEGLADYSVELASNIGFEIRDVYETGVDVIYALIGAGKRISRSRLGTILDEHGMPEENREEFTQLLMWFGVIGLVDSNGMAQYIYNQRYEMQKLKSIHRASNSGDPMFEINPAFWSALEVDTI